jgi:hypothetical protein
METIPHQGPATLPGLHITRALRGRKQGGVVSYRAEDIAQKTPDPIPTGLAQADRDQAGNEPVVPARIVARRGTGPMPLPAFCKPGTMRLCQVRGHHDAVWLPYRQH